MSRRQRLSADDWLNAGLQALAASGPEALKAEPLARALDTTKGSFYWHFEDVPRYRQALLQFWRDLTGKMPAAPAEKAEAVARLHAVMRDGFGGDMATESAIRSWATVDDAVAEALAELDRTRLAHIDQEVAQSLVLRQIPVGACQQNAEVGMVGAGVPDLLSVEDPLAIDELGSGTRAC